MHIWMILKSIGCFVQFDYVPSMSGSDKNEYQLGKLENEMIVLLVHDPSLLISRFCIGVEAGHRDDPVAIEGIAHLTEHLIGRVSKLGSAFHGGLLTEELFLPPVGLMFTTDQHSTTYIVNTKNKDIITAAGMMASAIAEPRFEPSDIAPEIEVIDTKFGLQTNHPSFIRTDILADLHTTDGYLLRGGFGNKRTLEHPDTAESVKQFWENNYYGQKMSLVIFSPLSFEEMRKVADKFEGIRSDRNITRTNTCTYKYDDEEACTQLASFRPVEDLKLKEDALQYIYRTKAVGHVSLMDISIILPSFKVHDRVVPLGLIQYCIKNYLKNEAQSRFTDLGCAIPECTVMYHDHADYVMLTIELPLTTRGVANYKEVLDTVLETLRNVDLSEDSLRSWIWDRIKCFDETTNEYSEGLIKNMAIKALFSAPSTITRGSRLYEAPEIHQELIRKMFAYIADFNKWMVIIMDKDYEPDDKVLCHSMNDTCYEREKKPSYSSESQCYAYALPEGKDQDHSSCKHSSHDIIKHVDNPRSKEARENLTWTINLEGRQKYRCLSLLLLELARMEVQAAQAAEKGSIDDEVLITLSIGSDPSACEFTLLFSTEGTEDALRSAVKQYLEVAEKPKISDAFEVAKVFALYHQLSENTLPMMFEREEFLSTGDGIDRLSQAKAISSLRNEEIVGMSVLDGTDLSRINPKKENDWNAWLTLNTLSLPDYTVRCGLPKCASESTDLCITEPMSDTVACSYFQYKISNVHTLLCDILGTKPNVEDAEQPHSSAYDACMCGLIVGLLEPTFVINEAPTKLHAYFPRIDIRYMPRREAPCIYFSVPSKSPMEDHAKIIDAFILSGSELIAKTSSDSFNRVLELVMDQLFFDCCLEQLLFENNEHAEPDVRFLEQKRLLREVITQKNIVSIYSKALKPGRRFFIPSRHSGICA